MSRIDSSIPKVHLSSEVIMKGWPVLVIAWLFCHVASDASQQVPAPGASGTTKIQEALKIRGQTRNPSMILVFKNREEEIKFIKLRKNYKREILTTPY